MNPTDEQEGLYPETPQLGRFGAIASNEATQNPAFVDRKDKA